MSTIDLGRYAVDTVYALALWWLVFRLVRGVGLMFRDALREGWLK